MNALWFTARGAGLSALIVLSLATATGALGSLRSRRPATRIVVQYVHRTAAALGLLLIFVHVSTIVLDQKSKVSVAGALIPFASAYRHNAVAVGSIAAYLVIFFAAAGLARGRLAASPRAARSWRAVHACSYGAWVLAVVHGYTAGTDRSQSWVLILYFLCVVTVLIAFLTRVMFLDDAGSWRSTPETATGWR